MEFALSEQQEAIRSTIAKICKDLDDAYWLKKDREGGFPQDFYADREFRLARHLHS